MALVDDSPNRQTLLQVATAIEPLLPEVVFVGGPLAVERSTRYALTDQISISIPEAPIFIATKWDAFLDRGHDDYLGSHDLEDIISVVAGRSELAAELAATDGDVRTWLAERAADFSRARTGRLCNPGSAARRQYHPGAS